MKKINVWVLLFEGVLLMACSSENVCRVKGQMTGMEGQEEVYVLRSTGEFTKDTVLRASVENGSFAFELPQELWGERYELKFGNRRSSLPLFAEQGNITIVGNIESVFKAEVKGTPDNDKWMALQRFNMKQAEQSNRLRREVGMNAPDSVRQKYAALFQEINARQEQYEDSLARSDEKSVCGLYLYYTKLWKWKYNEIDEILARFPSLQDNRYYKEMKEKADVLRKIAPGAVAPDFEVKTVDGGTVKLSSFRGKYLILDFWASWCAPCRQETVHIKELYNKYHKAGLEIFSVSLDDKKEAWVKAIKEDGMDWEHGCQLLKGGKYTPVAQLYGIDGIPAIWVIDPDGKILAQGLKGGELVEFCGQLFQGKAN